MRQMQHTIDELYLDRDRSIETCCRVQEHHVGAAMVPTTRNLLHHDGKSCKPCFHPHHYCVGIAAQLEHRNKSSRSSPRLAMADDDEPAAEAGTTSSRGGGGGGEGDDGEWLQLGLSGGAAAAASSSSASSSGDNRSMDPAAAPAVAELDLFTCYDDKRSARMMMRPPLPLIRSYHHQSSSYGRGRHRPPAPTTGSLSAPLMPPFKNSGGDAIRVISPPRRTEAAAGLWLKLEAAPNQVREPILPQIPKSYLRIKDSNMKVEVVVKYVAEKLGISSRLSHQVELTCRGQLLPPFLLAKHVRDTIWCSTTAPPREAEWLADLTASRRSSPAAAPTDHVMTLCYSTTRNSKLVLHL